MSRSHAVLKFLRTIHLYLGIFISPALLFFAFTGALQTFSLHESGHGSSYQPPKWIMGLAQLHKKQTLVVPQRKPRPDGADGGEKRPERPGRQQAQSKDASGKGAHEGVEQRAAGAPDKAGPKPGGHLPMKIFFLAVALGLFTSTLTGIYMAYRYSRGVWIITGLLAAGVVLPLLLLPF